VRLDVFCPHAFGPDLKLRTSVVHDQHVPCCLFEPRIDYTFPAVTGSKRSVAGCGLVLRGFHSGSRHFAGWFAGLGLLLDSGAGEPGSAGSPGPLDLGSGTQSAFIHVSHISPLTGDRLLRRGGKLIGLCPHFQELWRMWNCVQWNSAMQPRFVRYGRTSHVYDWTRKTTSLLMPVSCIPCHAFSSLMPYISLVVPVLHDGQTRLPTVWRNVCM
jgi:hypothetical protein